MTKRYLSFKDLVEAGVVRNRPTLYHWQRTQGFPAGIKLGPNTVAFDSDEVQAWLDSRQRTEGEAA